MRVGKVLRCYRVMNEMGMRELAKEIGTSSSSLCRIEKGKPIEGVTMLRIITWLFSNAERVRA